jgi:predicted RNA binding protein YcfA (HicA-like mRNA interferase family)
VPRLKATFDQVLQILLQNGFELHRHDGTSHRHYRGVVDGKVHIVTLAPHSWSDDVRPDTLKSIIRQSGLSKKLFRR